MSEFDEADFLEDPIPISDDEETEDDDASVTSATGTTVSTASVDVDDVEETGDETAPTTTTTRTETRRDNSDNRRRLAIATSTNEAAKRREGAEERFRPLPGYGEVDCEVCALHPRRRRQSGSVGVLFTGEAEIMRQVTRKYHRLQSRPKQRRLVKEFSDQLQRGRTEEEDGENRGSRRLSFLSRLSSDQLLRHLDEDHDRCRDKIRDPKDDIRHTILTALHVQRQSLCETVRKGSRVGTTVLSPRNWNAYLRGVDVYFRCFPEG